MHPILRLLLTPFSYLYGSIMWVRSKCYQTGIFSSRSFPVPVISVGNITVGGTGKTPTVEYLIQVMQERYKLAVLSRGYGRKTKGYRLVNANDDPSACGDEPLQIKQRFPKVQLAVCEDRVKGLKRLLEEQAPIDIVLLDDAFQHLRVKPYLNILLSNYHRPYYKDLPFPAGRLREFASADQRADAVIITKSPVHDVQEAEEKIKVRPLIVSSLSYEVLPRSEVYGFSGLADNALFHEHLQLNYDLKGFRSFKDHHLYTAKEIEDIKKEASGVQLVCTAKDAVKLKGLLMPEEYKVIHIDMYLKDELPFVEWLNQKLEAFES